MIGSFENHRNQQVTVSIEELVETSHFLRTVGQLIAFSFIDQITTPYYCQTNGHPSIMKIKLL